MSELPGELAGLPVGGPATLALVKAELQIEDDDHTRDVRLQMYVDAVNSQIRLWPVAERSVDLDAWIGSTVLGAVWLVLLLDARRNSPEGVAEFGSDGPVYVRRVSPDIAQLLELGDWSKPAVG